MTELIEDKEKGNQSHRKIKIDVDISSATKNGDTSDDTDIIALDLNSLAPSEPPGIFEDYFFHSGSLRAGFPKIYEWPSRVPENECGRHLLRKYREKIKDYHMLADANKRSDNLRREANCYICIGILYDNCKMYKKAITYYLRFVNIIDYIQKNMEDEIRAEEEFLEDVNYLKN